MKSPGFLQGVGMALVLSVAGSALFALFTQVAGSAAALRWVITLVAGAYLLFLLHGSVARVGKVTTVLAWSAVTGLGLMLHLALLPYLLIHIGLLWLVRCLYFYRNLLAALMDMGLQCLSFAAAIWAVQETGSLLLCLWSFFLIQALFAAIPPTGFWPPRSATTCMIRKSSFQRAHKSAEAALRRLC